MQNQMGALTSPEQWHLFKSQLQFIFVFYTLSWSLYITYPKKKKKNWSLYICCFIRFPSTSSSAVALPRFEGIDLCKALSPTMKNSDGDLVQRTTLLELVASSTEINQSCEPKLGRKKSILRNTSSSY